MLHARVFPPAAARQARLCRHAGIPVSQHWLNQRRSVASRYAPESSSAATGVDNAAAAADSREASTAAPPTQEVGTVDVQELISELQDQSQLGKRGEVWTLAQLALIALVLLPPFQLTELANFVGGSLIVGGLAAMVLGQQFLGQYLSPLPVPRSNSQLVTSGIYSYMRHPMYGGLVMSSLGLAAVTHDETRLLLAALLWLVLEQKVDFEEKLLVERYGAAYTDYKSEVKKFIPYLY